MGGKTKKKSKSQQWGPGGSAPQHDHQGTHRGRGADLDAVASATPAVPVMECEICNEKFDSGNRKPRNLRCGHGFCTACCKAMVKHKTVTCPKCRYQTRVENAAEDLAVNYPVLDMVMASMGQSTSYAATSQNRKSEPQKRKETSPHGGKCLEAQAEVSMHCAYCHMWLCKDCSRIDHSRPECLLTPFRETLAEMRQAGTAKAKSAENTLKELSYEVKAYSGKLRSFAAFLEVASDCVKKEQGNMASLLDHSQVMDQEMRNISAKSLPADVKEAMIFLDGLEEATSTTQQWAADVSASLRGEQVFKLSKMLMQTAVQMHMTGRSRVSGEVMGFHIIKGVQVTLPVEIDGKRLLVHAARQRAPLTGSRVVKLDHIKACIDPSCALTFIDISLRGQKLGRVFIRLLGCTKRSLGFLMMCSGEAGPSFLNTTFHRLWGPGLPGESVWAGDHDHGDGSGGTLPAEILHETKDLPEEKIQMAVTAGLVAGRYGKTNTTIFRVYTNQSSDSTEEAAFGRVEYGLHVLKDALKNNKNITDLTISGCGMVVEP